jgi:flagellar basal-body rod protein FlgG
MRTAASGMYAMEFFIDTIANNLANVNTTGFKRSKVEFQDILYQTQRAAGTSTLQGAQNPIDVQVGYGVQAVSSQKLFEQGDITQTDNPLDLAIRGNGFFQVAQPDGTVAYTRDGTFKLSSEGTLVTSDGFPLEPAITVPPNVTDIHIGQDGIISVIISGETEPQTVGQIELAKFINPAGLKNLGRNLYQATVTSGPAITGATGSPGFGTVSQGFVEASNVDVVSEMINMIVAQRAYEINSKTIRVAEEMLSTANNLKR